jgi:hypothetical protein
MVSADSSSKWLMIAGIDSSSLPQLLELDEELDDDDFFLLGILNA